MQLWQPEVTVHIMNYYLYLHTCFPSLNEFNFIFRCIWWRKELYNLVFIITAITNYLCKCHLCRDVMRFRKCGFFCKFKAKLSVKQVPKVTWMGIYSKILYVGLRISRGAIPFGTDVLFFYHFLRPADTKRAVYPESEECVLTVGQERSRQRCTSSFTVTKLNQ